jgi:SET domain-containing protein
MPPHQRFNLKSDRSQDDFVQIRTGQTPKVPKARLAVNSFVGFFCAATSKIDPSYTISVTASRNQHTAQLLYNGFERKGTLNFAKKFSKNAKNRVQPLHAIPAP